jgi:hypothetical protein
MQLNTKVVTVVSKTFSFRLPDEAVQALESQQLEGESLNQAAQRLLLEALKISPSLNADLSTTVDIKEIIKQEIESAIANSELLQGLVADKTAYLASCINQVKLEVDERLGKLKAR